MKRILKKILFPPVYLYVLVIYGLGKFGMWLYNKCSQILGEWCD